MSAVDVDTDGRPIDPAMQLASDIVHERTASQLTFAGVWLDLPAREIHLAFAGSTAAGIVADLQARVPSVIRLRAHDFQYPLTELEALQQAVGRYMEREGYWPQFAVDMGVQVTANLVHMNLKHTTPPEVLEAIRSQFPEAPLEIDVTTSRWVGQ